MTTPISTPTLTTRPAEPRATPPSTGQRFRETLAQGVGALASIVPGGQSLVAVARSGTSSPSASAPAGGSLGDLGLPGGTGFGASSSAPGGLVDAAQDQSMQLLALQQQMNLENRQFTTVSNVMRARHDTAKSVIGNVRG